MDTYLIITEDAVVWTHIPSYGLEAAVVWTRDEERRAILSQVLSMTT